MSGLTFSLARDSTLRTTLIDEATGHAMYQVDTPQKLSSSYTTNIRKLGPATQPPPYSDDGDSDSDEDLDQKKCIPVDADEDELVVKLPETSDEMARIYWKLNSPNSLVFRGKASTRSDFLHECGKMRG